ncbi:amidase [Hydrogenophaga sp.]|uniref:amidase n=1 Tax=Hydrogenophaga sp. TaxID=1904254 RepID=UPI003F702C1D
MGAFDVVEASATELIALVRGRQLTAKAVVRAFLDRTERLEPSLNTYVTLTPEGALEAAAAVDARIEKGLDPGRLAGLPISVKDLIAVGGVRQTFGSRLWETHVPSEDAPSVARLRAEGACIVGKTTTSELGSKAVGDSPLTGVTRNPWNLSRTPGGSSAGAASGVAARMVPVALGTDGGGSIRIPAAFCGLVGFKATFGRVPVWPPSATASVAHVCPIGRNIRDVALVLSVVSGHDVRDPGAMMEGPMDWVAATEQGVDGLRIGWLPDMGYGDLDGRIQSACEASTYSLAAERARIIVLPPLFQQDPAPAWNQEFFGAIAERLLQQGEWDAMEDRIDPALCKAARRQQSNAMPEDAVSAMRRQVLAALERAFELVDVIALPTVPVSCPAVGVDVPVSRSDRNAVDWSYFTYPFNLSGHPAVSLPVALDMEGMPIGLQLVAARGAESTLVKAVAALERTSPFRSRPPLATA